MGLYKIDDFTWNDLILERNNPEKIIIFHLKKLI